MNGGLEFCDFNITRISGKLRCIHKFSVIFSIVLETLPDCNSKVEFSDEDLLGRKDLFMANIYLWIW